MRKYLFRGCAHVGILSGNVDECVKFYCEKLGFKPYYQGNMGPIALTFVENNGFIVEFIPVGSGNPGGCVDHIALEVQGIEAAVADLRANGVEIGDVGATPTMFPTGFKNVFFTGPAGEKIELVEFTR